MTNPKGEKPKPGLLANVVTLAIFGFLLYACLGPSKEKTSEELATERAAEAEKRTKGFHCLSSWDGSHSAFANRVKSMMREPDSFEHIETKVTPVDASGMHTIFMQYRARNGFGGMNVGTALGTYKNSDCSFEVLSIE